MEMTWYQSTLKMLATKADCVSLWSVLKRFCVVLDKSNGRQLLAELLENDNASQQRHVIRTTMKDGQNYNEGL